MRARRGSGFAMQRYIIGWHYFSTKVDGCSSMRLCIFSSSSYPCVYIPPLLSALADDCISASLFTGYILSFLSISAIFSFSLSNSTLLSRLLRSRCTYSILTVLISFVTNVMTLIVGSLIPKSDRDTSRCRKHGTSFRRHWFIQMHTPRFKI